MGSMGVGQLAAWVTVLGGLLLGSAYSWADRGINYTQVTATVETVGTRCRPATLDPAGNEALAQSPVWRDRAWGSCTAAEAWVRRNNRLAHVVRGRFAEIRYISPADGREYRGHLRVDGRDQARLVGGAQVRILAHNRDPLGFEPT